MVDRSSDRAPVVGRLPEGARQLLAFVLVGGGGAVAFVLLSTAAIRFGPALPEWVVSTVCYALLILPVYALHRRFSFRSGAPHRRALPRYAGTQIGALALAAAFSYLAYHALGLPTPWAAISVTVATSLVTFVTLKLWAFAHTGPHAGRTSPAMGLDTPS